MGRDLKWVRPKAMPAAEFDDMLDVVSTEANADKEGKRTPSTRTQGAPGGFHSASIPESGLSPIRPEGRPALRGTLSDPNVRMKLPLQPEATEKRLPFALPISHSWSTLGLWTLRAASAQYGGKGQLTRLTPRWSATTSMYPPERLEGLSSSAISASAPASQR